MNPSREVLLACTSSCACVVPKPPIPTLVPVPDVICPAVPVVQLSANTRGAEKIPTTSAPHVVINLKPLCPSMLCIASSFRGKLKMVRPMTSSARDVPFQLTFVARAGYLLRNRYELPFNWD